MKKKLLTVLLVVSILTLLPIISVQAKKPTPHLTGTMDLDFNLGFLGVYPDGPYKTTPCWIGTIKIDGYEYDMIFYHLTLFKGYSKASDFMEKWIISDSNGNCLAGYDSGLTNTAQLDPSDEPPTAHLYIMTGKVEEATGVFADWLGRKVHMSGYITYQFIETNGGLALVPETAPGTFRIN